jgi:hypothetical protein
MFKISAQQVNLCRHVYHLLMNINATTKSDNEQTFIVNKVLSESQCALSLRYVDLVVSIEVAAAVCCCFTVFSC